MTTSRVWILGAGFSRSLGAPLLNDLLSFRLRHRLIQMGFLRSIPKDAAKPNYPLLAHEMVYSLFHFGMNYPEGYAFEHSKHGSPIGEKLWDHAEEFLEFLDSCASDPEGVDRLENIRRRVNHACLHVLGSTHYAHRVTSHPIQGDDKKGLTPNHLLTEAKRIISAECCEFLRKPSKERVKPYHRWMDSIRSHGGGNTIVTFNYDVVVEKIADDKKVQLQVAGTDPEQTVDEQMQFCREREKPLLVKLHGSVDWARDDGHRQIPFVRSRDSNHATKHPEEGQIYTPGEAKLIASQRELHRLWEAAANRICFADEVYFLGYRIPESDALAREFLFDAIRKNKKDHENPLKVHIVLGAPHFDRDRLKALLGLAGLRENQILVKEMWVEDFLAGWEAQEDGERVIVVDRRDVSVRSPAS